MWHYLTEFILVAAVDVAAVHILHVEIDPTFAGAVIWITDAPGGPPEAWVVDTYEGSIGTCALLNNQLPHETWDRDNFPVHHASKV